MDIVRPTTAWIVQKTIKDLAYRTVRKFIRNLITGLFRQCGVGVVFANKHYCVLSNSGLSNATSKRPKFV